MIPYGRQSINDDDIREVVKVLRSDWLTQGPKVGEFEKALAEHCGAKYAVVASSGTAAMQAAYYAIGLKEGDEFITTPLTFPATANAGIWQGGRPVFVDVSTETGNIDADEITEKITSRTRAVVPVDYAGRPVDLEKINFIAQKNNLVVIEDACQALGAVYQGRKIGSWSDLTVFSFHPVKSITTGEGGAILTDNEEYFGRLKKFVNHGVARDHFINNPQGEWYFEVQDLGQNYRLTDIQCALGLSQLRRIEEFVAKRKFLACRYSDALAEIQGLATPPMETGESRSAWHLYIVRLLAGGLARRKEIFDSLRKKGIGVQVHHIPVYLHPFYQKLGYQRGICPKAEKFYDSIISLPLYPDITTQEQYYIIKMVKEVLK